MRCQSEILARGQRVLGTFSVVYLSFFRALEDKRAATQSVAKLYTNGQLN